MNPFLIITPLVSIIAAILGALVGGYMSRAASLEAIEKAHKNNLILQEKNRKADAYSKVIEALYNAKASADQLLMTELHGFVFPDKKKETVSIREGAAKAQGAAEAEIWKAISTGTFLLSHEAHARLEQYNKDIDEAWEVFKKGSFHEYLEHIINAAERCLKDIIEIAKGDLKAE